MIKICELKHKRKKQNNVIYVHTLRTYTCKCLMYRKLHMHACKCLMYRKFLQDTHQTRKKRRWGEEKSG